MLPRAKRAASRSTSALTRWSSMSAPWCSSIHRVTKRLRACARGARRLPTSWCWSWRPMTASCRKRKKRSTTPEPRRSPPSCRSTKATIRVQNGTLNAGDFFICGSVFGKVRALFDDRGRVVKDAPPSTPVEVLGLQGVPDAGDLFQVTDEAKARHVVEYRQGKQRDAAMARISGSRITLDQLHEQLKAGDVKELGIGIKADVQGYVVF